MITISEPMTHKFTIILLLLSLPIAAHAQTDYTIPKKHRVIQEKTPQSRNVRVGAKVSDISFTALQDKTFTLFTLLQQGPLVFVFLSTECPVAQRYTVRLKRMHAEFADKHVGIIGVYSNENDSVNDVKAYMARAAFPFPIVKDTDGSLARHLGATMTPQAHLIDKAGVLRYRGSIDDNRYETRIKHHYLKDALVAIVSGKPVPVKETAAFGCTIHLPDLPTEKQITYSEHIAPILQKNCLTCHQQHGIAPFALADYEDAKVHAAKIAEQTQKRLMPPWKPVRGYGEFKNERRLTDTEIEMIANWVNADTPAGTKINDPLTTQSGQTWAHGEPDYVDETQNKFTIQPASFFIRKDFQKDMYVQGIDFQLKKSKMVRGVTVIFGSKLITKQIVRPDGSKLYSLIGTNPKISDNSSLGVCTPGFASSFLPKGVGFLLPKGTDIILDMKYHASEHQEPNSLRVGLYFSETPKTAPLRRATLKNHDYGMSRDTKQKNIVSSYQFKTDVYVIATFPYAHSYKQDMRIVAITPTGKHIKMLWIQGSDFNWQDIYYYQKPIFLPAGSRLEFDIEKDSENHNSLELSDQNNKKTIHQICNFLYVLASEYEPD